MRFQSLWINPPKSGRFGLDLRLSAQFLQGFLAVVFIVNIRFGRHILHAFPFCTLNIFKIHVSSPPDINVTSESVFMHYNPRLA